MRIAVGKFPHLWFLAGYSSVQFNRQVTISFVAYMYRPILCSAILFVLASICQSPALGSEGEGPRSWKALESQELFIISNKPPSKVAGSGGHPAREKSGDKRARELEDRFFKVQNGGPLMSPRSTVLQRKWMVRGQEMELLFAGLVTLLGLMGGLWTLKMGLFRPASTSPGGKVDANEKPFSPDKSLSMDGMVVAAGDSDKTVTHKIDATHKQPSMEAAYADRFEFSHESSTVNGSENVSETVSDCRLNEQATSPQGSRQPTFSGSLAKHGKWLMASEETSDSFIAPHGCPEDPTTPSSPLRPDLASCLEEACEWSPKVGKAITWHPESANKITTQKCHTMISGQLTAYEEHGIISNQVRYMPAVFAYKIL